MTGKNVSAAGIDGGAAIQLIRPTGIHLPSYVKALERGWSPNTTRPEAGREELVDIRSDSELFVARMDDPGARGERVKLPDGSIVARLPSIRRWMWDGEFCGSIGLRWQEGTTDLPPHCLGHIGYSVVPWKEGLGYAKAALAQLLPEVRALGLPFVDITTDLDNVASQRVVIANGGFLVERFVKPPQFGGSPALRFRIAVA